MIDLIYDRSCSYEIKDSTMSENSAVEQGGIMKYNFYRPNITNSIKESNFALYGDNFASYPIKMELMININGTYQMINPDDISAKY